MDRVATRRDPLLHDQAYLYDLNGNLSQTTDRKSQITNYTYDALNRLTQVTYADTSTSSYTYDAGDRLTQVVDSLSGTITYGYDNLDRLTSKTTPQGSISYTYDAAGRRTSMTVAGQPVVGYTYDNGSRLTQITQGSSTVTIAYDDIGRRTSLTLPNGIVTEYGYDVASQLTSLTYKQGANVIGDLTYEYDVDGRRTRMGGSFARSVTASTLSSAAYNAANQQLSFGGQTHTYDLNGNLTSDGTNTYTWDVRNHLVSISGPSINATFQYDAAGRRTIKTVNGASTSFLYDGANIVQEQSAQTGTANLLNGGIDETFSRSNLNGTWSPLVDALGSLVALTDAAGTPQTEYAYGAFGQSANTGSTNENSAQYTGRENDGTGLQYNRARYYSATLQRFISQDPLGFGGGMNFYAYVDNDPINSNDPEGLWPSGHWAPLGKTVHQNSIQRVLGSRLSQDEIDILKQEQYDWDGESQDEDLAFAHAMRARGQCTAEARRLANSWVRLNIALAQSLAKAGHRQAAMRYLAIAMHTLQDSTSPEHVNFQAAWPPTLWEEFNNLPHLLGENFDPGAGSVLDMQTEQAYKYFTGQQPMPDNFFVNAYDTSWGPATFRPK